MTRLTDSFNTLQTQKRTALIPFITAGDPKPYLTVPLMRALVAAGADILELGMPFSDPMADGPVIQRASERALAAGTHLWDVLEMVKVFRRNDEKTPVVLMGYLNPIEIMGYEEFSTLAQSAGVDGVLIVDLPPEEATELTTLFHKKGLAPIFLIAPTSTPERIRHICEQARGYVYYVSLKGVTGSANLDTDEVAHKLAEIRQYTDLPIGVGFGIRNAETATEIAKISSAVIVGSALVQQIETVAEDQLLTVLPEFLYELRQAIDRVQRG
jgi:tryptophan synthase alpha chain